MSLKQQSYRHPANLHTDYILTFSPISHFGHTEIKWNKPLNNCIRTAGIWLELSDSAIFDLLYGTILSGWRRSKFRGKAALLRSLRSGSINVISRQLWVTLPSINVCIWLQHFFPPVIFSVRILPFQLKKTGLLLPVCEDLLLTGHSAETNVF